MDDVLGGCGLHVCASDVEGWGQVVIDAAAHGIPTIGRDVPGLRDSIVDGRTGWLVRTGGGTDLPAVLADRMRAAIAVLVDPAEQGRTPRVPCVGRSILLGPHARRGRRGHRRSACGQSLPISTTRS